MDIVTDNSFKYNLKKLEPNAKEYDFIKDFFYLTTHPYVTFKNDYQLKTFRIYKVRENVTTSAEGEKRNNLMLFHGTHKEGAAGILKEGFRNSESGWFGRGVYMTDCSDTAFVYASTCRNVVDDVIGRYLSYVFVNEVLESEKLRTFTFEGHELEKDEDNDAELMYPFELHVDVDSRQPGEGDYKEDSLGRKYRNIEIDPEWSHYDEFIADEKITVPRYLIALETVEKRRKINFSGMF